MVIWVWVDTEQEDIVFFTTSFSMQKNARKEKRLKILDTSQPR